MSKLNYIYGNAGLKRLKEVTPEKSICRDGSDMAEWWHCPMCGAGWNQYVNEIDGKAKSQAQACIDRHKKDMGVE